MMIDFANDTVKIRNKKGTLIIAHRGISGLESENTNAAFVAAGNRTHYGIETDVHKTADGKFVLMHDDNTFRMTGEHALISKTDYDALRKMRIKPKDGRIGRSDLLIPSLEEYIDICRYYGKVAVLELKDEFTAEDIEAICNIIKAKDYIEKTVFISFFFNNLMLIKKRDREQSAQFLTGFPVDNELLGRLAEYDIGLDTEKSFCTPELIAKCHVMGIKVNAWTVNTADEAERLIEMGIDFITTNILE